MVDTLAALVSNTESTPVGIPQNRREGSTPLTFPKYWREGSTPDGFRNIGAKIAPYYCPFGGCKDLFGTRTIMAGPRIGAELLRWIEASPAL